MELSQHDDVLSQNLVFDEKENDHSVELSQHDDVLSQNVVFDSEEEESTSRSSEQRTENNKEKDKDWSHLVVFTAHKAGMEKGAKRSKEEINRIIYESSKNSKFFENARARDKDLDKRIEKLKSRLENFRRRSFHQGDETSTKTQYSQLLATLEKKRDLTHTWCVVDMDMFFASVEMRDDPSLKGKPFAVGGMGMISTANYEARKYGVRSAMPGFIARKLCPELVFVRPNFKKYVEVAKITREIFARYDPEFTAMSLDEASLDLTNYVREVDSGKRKLLNEDDSLSHLSTSERVVREIREEILKQTKGCTASAGIAPNKMLAKIASEVNKPNGQFYIKPNASSCIEFMRERPLRKIPGVGKVTERILREVLGLETCGELLQQPRVAVEIDALFKQSTSHWLLASSLGIANAERSDEHKRSVGPTRKGISVERTFRVKYEKSDLMTQLKHIATTLSEQMREKKLFGKTLTLKLKTEDFRVISRSKTLARHIQHSDDIFRIAKRFLLDQLPIRLRLMGIRLANFKGSAPALLRGQKKLDNFFRKSDETPSIPKTNVTTTTTSLSKKKRKRKQNILESMYKSPSAQNKKKRSGWVCKRCTFLNTRIDFLACEACNTPRYENSTPSQ